MELELTLVKQIKLATEKHNIDNISRTIAYHKFFVAYPEIEWAFLASMVSRNAGWNMCDLKGNVFSKGLSKSMRKKFFYAYERANWLIFADAFPQLLVYHWSMRLQKPLFHLLKLFNVSKFMIKQWEVFWDTKNKKILTISLIINEQHVIQKPVIEQHFYKKYVFFTFPFFVQDWMHFSSVLFPNCKGELYGFSVHGFRHVKNRIKLGKRLYWLLFYSGHFQEFKKFATKTVHTGSRNDYEQYHHGISLNETPKLREVYSIVQHRREEAKDWYKNKNNRQIQHYFQPTEIPTPFLLNKWYEKKRKQLRQWMLIKERIRL